MIKTLKQTRTILISFLILIILWQLAVSFGGMNTALFPSPAKVFNAFIGLATKGLSGSTTDAILWIHIKDSLVRFFIGYFLAAILGIGFGLLLGWFPKAFSYVNPIVQLIRPIAPVAWLPFLVLVIGIGNLPAIAIIFIAGFFPILLSTVKAVINVDSVYLKVAKTFGLTQLQTIFKIVLPAAFPQIFHSLHLALGTCWIFLVSGEMVGSQAGLGFLLMDAKNTMRPDALLAVIITIGIIGLILDQAIGLFEKAIRKTWGFGG